MNPKSKKYQGLCELNKENHGQKQLKSKPSSQKDIAKPLQNQHSKPTQLLAHLYPKHSINNQSFSLNHQLLPVTRNDSRKNIVGKFVKDSMDSNKQNKEKITKLPKINKEDCGSLNLGRKRRSKSYKKIYTEPQEFVGDEVDFNMKTLSPKESMKEVLLNIVKNKETRHLLSIDQEIDKLESLTKRYSGLRKDLVSIQEDILTISFKQKCKQKGKEASESNSAVFN